MHSFPLNFGIVLNPFFYSWFGSEFSFLRDRVLTLDKNGEESNILGPQGSPDSPGFKEVSGTSIITPIGSRRGRKHPSVKVPPPRFPGNPKILGGSQELPLGILPGPWSTFELVSFMYHWDIITDSENIISYLTINSTRTEFWQIRERKYHIYIISDVEVL